MAGLSKSVVPVDVQEEPSDVNGIALPGMTFLAPLLRFFGLGRSRQAAFSINEPSEGLKRPTHEDGAKKDNFITEDGVMITNLNYYASADLSAWD